MSFSEFSNQVKGLKSLTDWLSKISADRIIFKKMLPTYLLPELEIIVDNSLGFTVKVFSSYLVANHHIKMNFRQSMCNVTLSNLIEELKTYKLCEGVTAMEMTSKLYHHVAPMNHDSMDEDEGQQFPHKGYWRPQGCCLLSNEQTTICSTCKKLYGTG